MPRFISLPSGLVVNLELVNRMAPTDEQGEPSLILYFSSGETMTLTPSDASALRKRATIQGTTVSNNVQTAVFWLCMIAAVVWVYLAMSTGHKVH